MPGYTAPVAGAGVSSAGSGGITPNAVSNPWRSVPLSFSVPLCRASFSRGFISIAVMGLSSSWLSGVKKQGHDLQAGLVGQVEFVFEIGILALVERRTA